MSKPVIHWFKGDSVTLLKQRLNASENPWFGVVLQKDEAPLLRVVSEVAAAETSQGDINDSHTCPPFMDCPPG